MAYLWKGIPFVYYFVLPSMKGIDPRIDFRNFFRNFLERLLIDQIHFVNDDCISVFYLTLEGPDIEISPFTAEDPDSCSCCTNGRSSFYCVEKADSR